MKILLTAFEPFGGEERNSSLETMDGLPGRIEGAELIRVVLPVTFSEAGERAWAAAMRYTPNAVVSLGQAGGRDALCMERIAVNCMDASIPDNLGYQPAGLPVVPGGPDGLFSTLPIREMARAAAQTGAPARVSDTAGTFVCNAVMYRMLCEFRTRSIRVPCGFLHVPWLEGQAEGKTGPRIPITTAVRGTEAALAELVRMISRE